MPKISNAEWRIMKLLWQRAPQTANELISTLADRIEWSPRTVKTMLNRLVKKGVLGFVMEGREYLYSPRISEADCIRDERNSFLARVYDGALTPMIVAFLNEHTLCEADIADLKAILEHKEKKV